MFLKGLKYEFRAISRIVTPLLITLLAISILLSVGLIVEGRVSASKKEKAEEMLGDDTVSVEELNEWLIASGLSEEDLEALLESGALTEEELALMVRDDELYLQSDVMDALAGFLTIALVFLLIAINITVFVMIIKRFHTSFFTDEGYLTFTLPMSIDCHLSVKLVSMFLWNVLSAVVSVAAIFIILLGIQIGYAPSDMNIFEMTGEFFNGLVNLFRFLELKYVALDIILTLLYALVLYFCESIALYFGITLSNMIAKKHRVLAGIVTFTVISYVLSAVSSIGTTLLSETTVSSEIAYILILVINIALTAACAIGGYIGTKYILTHKLNLD